MSDQEKEQQIVPEEIIQSPSESDDSSEESSGEPKTIDPIELLQQQFETEKNQHLRLYAEFENFRRRSAKERIELIGTASADVIKDIVPILDDFERAINSNKAIDDLQSVKVGFELLYQKLVKIMAAKGLQVIESRGQMFDAEIHEAIAQVPAANADEKGKIIDVVENGYKLNDKVIRHPKVVVGS